MCPYATQKQLKQLLFDKSMCSIRWTKQYFIENSRLERTNCDNNDNSSHNEYIVINSMPQSSKKLSEQSKFNEASRIMKTLAARISEKTGYGYDYWICEIKTLVKFIESDEKIVIEKFIHVESTPENVNLPSGTVIVSSRIFYKIYLLI